MSLSLYGTNAAAADAAADDTDDAMDEVAAYITLCGLAPMKKWWHWWWVRFTRGLPHQSFVVQ